MTNPTTESRRYNGWWVRTRDGGEVKFYYPRAMTRDDVAAKVISLGMKPLAGIPLAEMKLRRDDRGAKEYEEWLRSSGQSK